MFPQNVIINPDGDVVIVNFKGGSTPGCIPFEILHAVEGDCLELKRIKEDMNLDLSDMPPPAKL